MEKLKVLLITNGLNNFLSHRLPLAKKMQEDGFEVHVALPAKQDQLEELSELNFYFHFLPLKRKSINPFNELWTIFFIVKLLRKLKPDLLYLIAIKSTLYGNIAAKLAKPKAIINAFTGLGFLFIHNTWKVKILRSVVLALLKLNLRYTKNTISIVQNKDDEAFLLSKKIIKKNQLVLIPGSGIDVSQFDYLNEPESSITVILPARLLWDKGVGEFVSAATQLKKVYPLVTFALVGEVDAGNPASVSSEQITTWVESGAVQHWGFIKDMRQVFSRCHVVCLPSYREGLPKALLEAAACGRAIVTADTPGCREVVEDGKTGFIVPVKSSEALAKAINELLSNKDLRIEMGKREREFVSEKFNLAMVLDKNQAIYKKLLRNS